MHQESLFNQNSEQNTPLANRVRPTSIDEFVGQQHLLGKDKILREIIMNDQLSSLIFGGPPGVGKTTLAEIIAKQTKSHFITFSAVTSSIRDIRKIMEEAEKNVNMVNERFALLMKFIVLTRLSKMHSYPLSNGEVLF